MRQLLVDMKKAHPGQDEALKTCWSTMLKFCGNVATNPQVRWPLAGSSSLQRRRPAGCGGVGGGWVGVCVNGRACVCVCEWACECVCVGGWVGGGGGGGVVGGLGCV